MIHEIEKNTLKLKRKLRTRAKLHNHVNRPRLCIEKSNYNLSATLVDDKSNKIIFGVAEKGKNIKASQLLSQKVMGLLNKHKIKSVVFDRSGYKYHGVIKSIAEALRHGGITI